MDILSYRRNIVKLLGVHLRRYVVRCLNILITGRGVVCVEIEPASLQGLKGKP